MFLLTIFIGLYAYSIFTLGIFSILYPTNITVVTILWICIFVLTVYRKNISRNRLCIANQQPLYYFLFLSLCVQIGINIIGALGPELAFDALWYHLTLPKIYLINHAIIHIPGGLLYYSDMPKIAEMFYTAALSFHSEILAKFIHFMFGLLCLVALYNIARKFFTPIISLFCIVIFYSNLVVGFESITAYIDLVRTFFEIMGFWAWLEWYQTKQIKLLCLTGCFIGFAITTKLLAIGSLAILLLLTMLVLSSSLKQAWKSVPLLLFCALSIPTPWFIFSFIHTGNPLYPFFTQTYPVSHPVTLLNPWQFITDLWHIFTHADDPISPVYIALIPFLIVGYSKMDKIIRLVVWYTFLALIFWYITPRTGGGRFLLPYLPIFSLLGGWSLDRFQKTPYAKLLIIFIVLISSISILYRGAANAKYIPVLVGKESKDQFLTNHLNFSFGDFYDTDRYFATQLGKHTPVLLVGFHNLFYVDFPFIDSSWVKNNTFIGGIAVQHAQLPPQYTQWKKVYQNTRTGVNFYIKM